MEDNIYLQPHTTNVQSFARWLGKRWKQAFRDNIRSFGAAMSNYASSIGHPCIRSLYYSRVGAERIPIEPRLQMIFRRGEVMEDDTISFLRSEMDVEWVRSQQSAQKDHLNIGMRIDGGIRGRMNRGDPVLIAEVKTTGPNEFRKIARDDIQGLHDMLTKCSWWLGKHVYQVVCYLKYFDEPGAIIIVRDPVSWDAKFLPMPADSPLVDKLWTEIEHKASTINDAVETEQEPPRIPYNKKICGMCDFATTVCFPEKEYAGTEILTHPDLVGAAKELLKLRDFVNRADEIKAYLREIVLQTGCDSVVVGDVLEAKVLKSGDSKIVRMNKLKGLFFGGSDE